MAITTHTARAFGMRGRERSNLNPVSMSSLYLADARAYNNRVIADGGTLVSWDDLVASYAAARADGWMTSVKAWWSAQAGYKDAGSGAVSKWYDLGPNYEDVVQATAGARPTWTANVQNGRAALVVDGGDFFTGKQFSASLPQPNTIFLVVQQNNYATQMYVGAYARSYRHQIYYDLGGSMYLYAGGFLGKAGDVRATGILVAVFSTDLSKLSLNGGAFTTGNTGSQNMSGITIFADETESNKMHANGFFCEIIVCSGHLSPNIIIAVQNYLNNKWHCY